MILEMDRVSVSRSGREILHGVTLNVERGEIVSLLGGNASGKTTTLRTIMGLCRIASGNIRLNGVDVTGLRPMDMVAKGVAIVPENRRLFGDMSVEENLRLVVKQGLPTREFLDALESIADHFPLLKDHRRWKQLAGTLSGGEQQQVAMARALLSRPALLLLDEPSMGMSVNLVAENFRVVQEIASRGISVFMVEQNVKMALSIASRGYILQAGVIVHQGAASELLANEMVRRAFLGEFL